MNKVIEIVKKNLLSIICGLIAILAMVAVSYPLGGWFDELRTLVNGRKAEYTALEGLAKKTRNLPKVDPTATEIKKLETFPTPAVIERGKAVIGEVISQSTSVVDYALKLNTHELLVPASLPAGQTSQALKYQDAYQKQVEFLSTDESIRSQTLPVMILQAGLVPSEAEIANMKVARETEIKNEKLVPGPNGNSKQVEAEIAAMQATISDEIKQDIAKKSKMYILPDSVDVYPGVYNTPTPPVASTIYYSQLGLWVTADVFKGLARANESSSNVTESVVKELVRLDISEDEGKPNVSAPIASGYTGANPFPGGFPGGGAPPPGFMTSMAPPPPPAEGAAAGSTMHSLTGRTSDALYQVIPFHLTILVDAQRIPTALAELSRNQFITVLKCDIVPVDSATAMINGYYYGPVPVVQLSLDCECLYLKSWLTKFMPPSIAAPPAAAG